MSPALHMYVLLDSFPFNRDLCTGFLLFLIYCVLFVLFLTQIWSSIGYWNLSFIITLLSIILSSCMNFLQRCLLCPSEQHFFKYRHHILSSLGKKQHMKSHNICNSLHSHNQFGFDPAWLLSCQNVLLLDFLMIVILLV